MTGRGSEFVRTVSLSSVQVPGILYLQVSCGAEYDGEAVAGLAVRTKVKLGAVFCFTPGQRAEVEYRISIGRLVKVHVFLHTSDT